MVLHLNDLPSEKRSKILENFFKVFEEPQAHCDKNESIVVKSEIKNTNTSDPTLTITTVGRLALYEVLEI